VDEAYAEFADGSLLGLVKDHENIVVGRTLSKAFGLAGLRLGYAVAPEWVAKEYRRISPLFSISGLSLAVSPQFSTFRPDPDRLEIAYLEWYCKQSKVWEALRNKARGMGARRDSVLPSQFLALSIPLPSVEEQRQIVARIEELAARIEEARELRRRAVEEVDAMSPSFLGKLFMSLSKQVDVISLDRLSSNITDGPHKTPTYVSDGIPFITVRNMVSGKLDFNNFQYISIKDHMEFSKHCKPEYGDVLYSKDGATRGHPCFVDTDREFNIFVSVALIKPIRDQLDGRYLCYVLKST
jgi:type I restriction enzyme, S subunit